MLKDKTTSQYRSLHLTPSEAATYIGCSVSKLAKSRMKGAIWEGPPYLKLGRQVLYRVGDLDCWIEQHLVHCGDETKT